MSLKSHNHGHDSCECPSSPTTTAQNLDELDFDRGIWSAALNNESDRLKKLISKGHLHDRDIFGYNALHYATRNGHLEICKVLVEAGININERTNGGATPLSRASLSGREAVVKYLISKKADPKIKDSDGRNPLHRAAENSYLKICEILLEYCPQLKSDKDVKGQVPFNLVPQKKLSECTEFKLLLSLD